METSNKISSNQMRLHCKTKQAKFIHSKIIHSFFSLFEMMTTSLRISINHCWLT